MRRRSRVAMAVAAVRRHKRRQSRRDEPGPGVRASTAIAIREATPRTVSGLVAQAGAVGVMATTTAGWRHRITLAPVLATGAMVQAAAWWPAPTATGLAVLGTLGGITARVGGPRAGGRRGLGLWAAGSLLWMGVGAVGGHEVLTWWQDLALLGGCVAPGAVAWWRPPPAPRSSIPAQRAMIPAAALLLGRTLEEACEADYSPLRGGSVLNVACPALNVAVAVVDLPHGMHAETVPGDLRGGLEARLDRAGRRVLGDLGTGSVTIAPHGVSRIQVTASWSKVLDEAALAWTPPHDLPPGHAWLGHDDARAPLIVERWTRGPDGRVSVHHIWVIGRTGGGKSTTIRALLAPGISTGAELVIPLDGKGDSLSDIAPYSVSGHVARNSDSWRQGIALAYAIFVARQQRLDTPTAWTEPRPDDPLITLIIDEYSSVGAGLTHAEVRMLCELARMGRSVGVATVQSGQNPLVDAVIGGSEWRSQARIVLGHAVADGVHDRIATQSGGEESPSLRGLPVGRIITLIDGQIVARRAKVALVTPENLTRVAAPHRPTLHPEDLRSDHVRVLFDLAHTWASSRPAAVVDIGDLLTQWTTTTDPTTGTTVDLRESRPGSGTGTARGAGVPQQGGTGGLRQLILTHLLVHPGALRADVAAHFRDQGWSNSGIHKAINQLIDTEQIIEEATRLAPALWIESA